MQLLLIHVFYMHWAVMQNTLLGNIRICMSSAELEDFIWQLIRLHERIKLEVD